MRITPATAAECAAMARVHAEAFDHKAWRCDEFEDLLEGAGIYGFFADGDAPPHTPIGVVLCRVAAGEMEVLTLGVAHAARRKGAGRALMAAALPAAREREAVECFLEVAIDNDPAIALYDALGFRKTGLRKSYYDRGAEGFIDALVMRLDLTGARPYPA